MEDILTNSLKSYIINIVNDRLSKYEAEKAEKQPEPERRTLRGFDNLAKYLGVSVPTVARWKAKNKAFSTCYVQRDRVVIFDLDKVDNFMKGGKRGK